MVRISFRADDLQRKLRGAPKSLKKQVREAMAISMRDVQERARSDHKFISRTGQAEESIHQTVMGNGEYVVGTVYTALPHAVFQHEGTPARIIVPRYKKVLRWTDGGAFVFAKRSHVRGIKGDPYIDRAFEREKPAIVSRFKKVMQGLGR